MCGPKVDGTDKILCPEAGFCFKASETLKCVSIYIYIYILQTKMRNSDLLSTTDIHSIFN